MAKDFTTSSRWKASAQLCSSVGAQGGIYLIVAVVQPKPDLIVFHKTPKELRSSNSKKKINEVILL